MLKEPQSILRVKVHFCFSCYMTKTNPGHFWLWLQELLISWLPWLQLSTWSRQFLPVKHLIPFFDSWQSLRYPVSHCVHLLDSSVRKNLLAFAKSSWPQESLQSSKNKSVNSQHLIQTAVFFNYFDKRCSWRNKK